MPMPPLACAALCNRRFKNLTAEDMLVYQCIQNAGNMGERSCAAAGMPLKAAHAALLRRRAPLRLPSGDSMGLTLARDALWRPQASGRAT